LEIKKLLKPTIPGVYTSIFFFSFILGLKTKTVPKAFRIVFYLTQDCQKKCNSDLSKGEVNRNPHPRIGAFLG
tara:strand:- start:702 stop:920 length:219 start_codon:yes stop_codon:yes gene_type:complete